MNKKVLPLFVCALIWALPAAAQLQKKVYAEPDSVIYGVIPSQNVTSLEINPAFNALDDGDNTTLNTLTLKGYYAFCKHWNVGAEVPLARFGSGNEEKRGLGDVSLSSTFTQYAPNDFWSFGAAGEWILPTATSDELGTGKVQFSPAAFAVMKLNEHFFVSFGYKQYWSVAGDGGRENINLGRIRGVIAYLSDNKWWVQLDPRYLIDYHHSGQAEFAPEAEIGTMVTSGTAVYLRGGGHVAGNMNQRDWGVSVGFKLLHL